MTRPATSAALRASLASFERGMAAALAAGLAATVALVCALAASAAPAPNAPTAPRSASSTASAAAQSASAAARTALAPAAPDGGIEREGPFWVQTGNGVVTVPEHGSLRLSSIGPVRLVGDGGADVRFTLTKRVRARNESEARRLLNGFVMRTATKGEEALIEVRHAGERGQAADLMVQAPRRLARVTIETHGGDVEASDLDGAVKAVTGGGRMKVDRVAGAVEATTAGGEIELGTIRGAVKCLSAGGAIRAEAVGGDASFETGGGEILVRSVGGTTRAVTAGGSITIGRAASTVIANTAGGGIQVDEVHGAVRAETLGGPIQIGSANGVHCETAGGGIRLNNVYGALRAATTVGNVFARLASGRTLSDSYLATHAGDITVLIPASFAVTIRAENDRGSGSRTIVSDFPSIAVHGQGPMTVAEGKINGGGPLLRLSGMGGTIYIKKQE